MGIVFLFFSCQKERIDTVTTDDCNSEISDGTPYFQSVADFNNVIEEVKSGITNYDKDGWVSRAEYLKQRKLTVLSSMNLKSAGVDESQISVEDSVVKDPYLLQLLNDKREVQIGDDVYKITDLGLFACPPERLNDLRYLLTQESFKEEVRQKLLDWKATHSLKSAAMIEPIGSESLPLDQDIIMILPEEPIYGGGGGTTTGGSTSNPSLLENAIMNSCDESNKTLAGELIKGVLGFNVNCENNFSSSKRVKTVFWAQNWFFYSSIGIKVKMQSKVLGVWFQKDAQELRLGWESMHYKMKTSISPEFATLKISPNVFNSYLSDTFSSWDSFVAFCNNFKVDVGKSPTFLELHQKLVENSFKEWQYRTVKSYNNDFADLVWYINHGDYDKIMNYVEGKSIEETLKYLKSKLSPEKQSEVEERQRNENISITFVDENFNVNRILLPQEAASTGYNTNKIEKILDYDEGAFSIGIGVNGSQPFFSFTIYKAPTTYEIIKGSSVFGIAKYDNTWRGSRITKNRVGL